MWETWIGRVVCVSVPHQLTTRPHELTTGLHQSPNWLRQLANELCLQLISRNDQEKHSYDNNVTSSTVRHGLSSQQEANCIGIQTVIISESLGTRLGVFTHPHVESPF